MGVLPNSGRRSIYNALLTMALFAAGYLFPFLAEHLSGSQNIGEGLLFLIGHTYFHYYLLCLTFTMLLMGWVWYLIESRSPNYSYRFVGACYGVAFGVLFSLFYILLGVRVYSFYISRENVIILVFIAVVTGTVTGFLRYSERLYV